jgi:hypothetical protein
MDRSRWITAAMMGLVCMTGCTSARYVTPGRGVDLSGIADTDIRERLSRQPAAPFPARLAVVRVQSSGYRSHCIESYGEGRYSVVTTRDIEQDRHIQRLQRLALISGVAPLNRLVLPYHLHSDKELRIGAAGVQADLLLMYTLDTSFRVKNNDIGPLGLLTLGFLPVDEAQVNTTASAAILDVRTGFIYGLCESFAREQQIASAWSSSEAVEQSRVRAERKAFEQMLGEVEHMWTQVLNQHAARPAGGAQPPVSNTAAPVADGLRYHTSTR